MRLDPPLVIQHFLNAEHLYNRPIPSLPPMVVPNNLGPLHPNNCLHALPCFYSKDMAAHFWMNVRYHSLAHMGSL